MTTTTTAMHELHNFSMNYPHNFINQCFGQGALADHLQGKFNTAYDRHGAMGVIPAFISMLDAGNRETLFSYIGLLSTQKDAALMLRNAMIDVGICDLLLATQTTIYASALENAKVAISDGNMQKAEGIAEEAANRLWEREVPCSSPAADSHLECEMCGTPMTQEDHDFSDICGECREGMF
jgi:hypothetical protein|tara:strand:- start:2168 stop:2710 length:543 start_codon:yes stop_codon:yes gene_type:complete